MKAMAIVALYVSAWIEIELAAKNMGTAQGRTLCECVD